jgi:hypothetical protein
LDLAGGDVDALNWLSVCAQNGDDVQYLNAFAGHPGDYHENAVPQSDVAVSQCVPPHMRE